MVRITYPRKLAFFADSSWVYSRRRKWHYKAWNRFYARCRLLGIADMVRNEHSLRSLAERATYYGSAIYLPES